jgi:hypothetical protein
MVAMTQTEPTSIADVRRAEALAEQNRARTWSTFACVIVGVIGLMNVIGGIGAIDDSKFFIGEASFVFADLQTYGWVLLITGIVQLLIPLGVRARSFPAVWFGVIAVSLNALAHLLMIPAAPYWSIAIVALDLAAVYGLITFAESETDTRR